jgi:O-antigen/teichoic acid export membrane protein
MLSLAALCEQFGGALSRLLPRDALHARLVENGVWSLVGAACLRAFSLLAWVVCARMLGKTGFGEVNMLLSTAVTLGVLAGMGLGVTATKLVAEYRETDPQRCGRIIGAASLVVLASGTALSLSLVVLAPVLSERVLANTNLTDALRLAALLTWCSAVSGFQSGALAGFESFRAIAGVNLLCGAVTLATVSAGAAVEGVRGALLGMIAAQILGCIMNHFAVRRQCAACEIRCAMSGCLREMRAIARFALPALLSSTLLLPAMWLCNAWLARQAGGYAQLGLYAAADRWRLLILFVPSCMFGTVLPMLSSLRGTRDSAGFRRVFRTNVLLNLALVAIPGIAVAAMARTLISLFGSAYAEGWPVLSVMAAGATAEAMNTALGQPLITESMWKRCGFDVLLVAVLLVVARVLIPRSGALGLALAYAAAFTTVSAALCLYTRSRVLVPRAAEGAGACPES